MIPTGNFSGAFFAALPKRGSVLAYILAFGLVGAGLYMRLELAPLEAGLQYVAFFPAVTMAAMFCGLGPAIAVTIVGIALATFIFTPPYYTASLELLSENFWPNMVFLFDGLVVCFSIETLDRYRRKITKDALESKLRSEAFNRERLAELEKAGENVRRFVQQAPICMAMYDENMNYLVASDRWWAEYGGSQANLVGRNNYECHPDQPEAWKAMHQQALAGATIKSDEELWQKADGTQKWQRWAVLPWKKPDGSIGGIIISAEVITAQKEAEEALRAALAVAEHANSAKSRFLAAASHDLRQPLSALSVYARLLAPRSPSEQKVVTSMQDCIGSLGGLLTDLLDTSKLDAGVVTPTVTDFPIAETLASLESANTPEAQVKGLQLRCLPSRLTARCDPVLYKRILGNLVANAIRYTEHGGVLVACRRRQGKVWVEVWDTGIGIPADKTVEIFEEFKQLGDGARNSGSGLGLAIAAKTAAVLGLEINVRSRSGRGSVFAVEMPLGKAVPAGPAPALSAVACRPLRIALVDDDPKVRSALDAGLQSLGHQVVAASSGAKLLDKLGTLTPDIVVSDYRLAQDETGFDVITAVRTQWGAAVPAILVTGDTDPNMLRSMTERGIPVLHKPVDLETMQAHIEEMTCEVA